MPQPVLTTRQRRTFWVALLAIPVVFFLLLEGGLRIGGYGHDTRLFVEVEAEGRQYYAINPGVARRYFSDPDFGTYVSRDRFLVDKPPGTYRIFALGASTTIGFPYMFHGSFSSLLKDRLYAHFPDRPVEVVNVGITAVNSYTVAEVAREVVRYEPDLLIVYAGHNEFYGAFGVGSAEGVGDRRWMVKAYLAAQRSRVFQLVRDGLRAVARAAASPPAVEGEQLMERMARDREIAYGSPAYERARRYYVANMEEVVDAARRRGVDILVSTLTSNLRDQPPFVSLHGDGVSEADRAEFARLLEQGIEAFERDDHAEAADHLARALEVDPHRADAHYHLARALEGLARADDAREAYHRARDLDALRFRASGDFSDDLRRLAEGREVALVDMEAAFAEASPGGVPGEELFWEHVHPTFEGYFLMGEVFARAMADNGLLATRDEWAASGEPGEEWLRRFAGLTEFDHEVARIRVELLTRRWPFAADAEPYDFTPTTPAQSAAWAYIRGETGWGAARDRLARHHREAGDNERAADELWAIAKVTPYSPHYAVLAGDVDAGDRRFERAAERYAFALHIHDSPQTRAKLGIALFETGVYDRAAAHLDHAVRVPGVPALNPPQRLQVHYLLGLAHLTQGDFRSAGAQVERLRAMAPNAPPTARLAAAVAAAEQAGRVVIMPGTSGGPPTRDE